MPRALTITFLAAAALLWGCSRDPYSQDTPDAVLKSAKLMVERGDAERLSDLLYAENEDMRRFFRRVGVMLGHLQDLGQEIAKAYPQELAALKADAEKAAKEGKATSLLQQFTGQQGLSLGRNRPSAEQRKKTSQAFNNAIKRLFADPYAFLADSTGRLKTAEVNDDVAALLWDGQTILPPVGLTMRKHTRDGQTRWGIALPWNLPVIANYVPRTPDEYKVLGSLIKTFDNVVVELTRDVKEKRVKNLDEVSRKAGERLFIPAAMVVYAYSESVKNRKKQTPAPKPSR